MNRRIRCQSCGMPLTEGRFGTAADGSFTTEYCRFCYQFGVFTEPNLTITTMIARCVDKMMEELQLSEEESKLIAETTIPQLKRWLWNKNKFK